MLESKKTSGSFHNRQKHKGMGYVNNIRITINSVQTKKKNREKKIKKNNTERQNSKKHKKRQ